MAAGVATGLEIAGLFKVPDGVHETVAASGANNQLSLVAPHETELRPGAAVPECASYHLQHRMFDFEPSESTEVVWVSILPFSYKMI